MRLFGQRIHCSEAGTGPVLVLLHGLGAESSDWARVAGPLAGKYRVITPDQIGFGQSDKPLIEYRVSTLVSFLEALYRQLRVGRATLVAHGVSGNAAALFSLEHPELVERLVLVATGFLHRGCDAGILNPATAAQARELVRKARYRWNEATVEAAFTEAIRSAWANARLIESIGRDKDSLDGRVGDIRHPTLIVWGREDRITPLEAGEQLLSQINQAQLVVFDGCGHAPHVEKPEEMARALTEFLSGERRRRRFGRRREEENAWF